MLVHKHALFQIRANRPIECFAENYRFMVELIDKLGMKRLSGPHAKYVQTPGNRGLTTVCIIETSHIAMHVWDEQSPALVQLDVYSCADFKPETVVECIQKYMEPDSIEYKFLDREHGFKEIDRRLLWVNNNDGHGNGDYDE